MQKSLRAKRQCLCKTWDTNAILKVSLYGCNYPELIGYYNFQGPGEITEFTPMIPAAGNRDSGALELLIERGAIVPGFGACAVKGDG
jgi:hypothetical protein